MISLDSSEGQAETPAETERESLTSLRGKSERVIMRGLEDSIASIIADFCILSRDAALRGVRLPGVLRDTGSTKSSSRRVDKDLALDGIALIIFASKSVFRVALLEVEVLEDSSPGFKACAGSEACGASVDTTSGFFTKSFASLAELVKVEGIVGTGVGPMTSAGSEACGASLDTVSGFTAKSGASALTFVWIDSR